MVIHLGEPTTENGFTIIASFTSDQVSGKVKISIDALQDISRSKSGNGVELFKSNKNGVLAILEKKVENETKGTDAVISITSIDVQ